MQPHAVVGPMNMSGQGAPDGSSSAAPGTDAEKMAAGVAWTARLPQCGGRGALLSPPGLGSVRAARRRELRRAWVLRQRLVPRTPAAPLTAGAAPLTPDKTVEPGHSKADDWYMHGKACILGEASHSAVDSAGSHGPARPRDATRGQPAAATGPSEQLQGHPPAPDGPREGHGLLNSPGHETSLGNVALDLNGVWASCWGRARETGPGEADDYNGYLDLVYGVLEELIEDNGEAHTMNVAGAILDGAASALAAWQSLQVIYMHENGAHILLRGGGGEDESEDEETSGSEGDEADYREGSDYDVERVERPRFA
mmetsp:Transcript_13297/g.41490  ORF Transcript_13297/g.41490 Transcript_13297/m.41490 type:complete len:312 (+) Transcript_13297:120-1055(+)